jgi:hypothetical protein
MDASISEWMAAKISSDSYVRFARFKASCRIH